MIENTTLLCISYLFLAGISQVGNTAPFSLTSIGCLTRPRKHKLDYWMMVFLGSHRAANPSCVTPATVKVQQIIRRLHQIVES
jgi:hypothetical protein